MTEVTLTLTLITNKAAGKKVIKGLEAGERIALDAVLNSAVLSPKAVISQKELTKDEAKAIKDAVKAAKTAKAPEAPAKTAPKAKKKA